MSEDDPFEDPAACEASTLSLSELEAGGLLTVDRNATLTLGTDALIVLDEGLRHHRAPSNCCGLLPQLGKTTKAIPFYNILWAELNDFDVIIKYAQRAGKKGCKVGYINYTVTEKSLQAHAKRWVGKLMDQAYPPNVQRKKRVKVLVNPFGGQGHALKLWSREAEPILAAARCEVDVERTAYRGHAVEIAQKLDVEAYDVIACASGDGLPHEVFNGLAKQTHPRRALRKVAVTQIPCGSGNAMSLNVNGTDSPSLATLAIVKGIRTPMDLVAITQGNSKYYSFCSQAIGIIAESDLGTESLRWMGSMRFTWGVLVRLFAKASYPAEVAIALDSDDKVVIKDEYHQAIELYRTSKMEPLSSSSAESIDGSREQADGYSEIPMLKYGTVLDPLHKDFQSQDMPDLGNFYVGKMCWMSPDTPFFTTSLPTDGKMDMINVSAAVSRITGLRMLATVAEGSMIDFPEVKYKKVFAYRIQPRMQETDTRPSFATRFSKWLGGAGKQREGLIAIDGERVPFEAFQAEVVPSLGTILSKRGPVFEWPPS